MNKLKIIYILILTTIHAWSQPQEVNQSGSPELNLASHWELSSTFDVSGMETDQYPHFFTIFNARWEPGIPDDKGWFNIERMRGTADVSAYGNYGRIFFITEENLNIKIKVEYQEEISVFLNGKFIQHGNLNPDKPAGSFDFEISPKKGLNELFIFLMSHSSEWKFRITSFPALKPQSVDHTLSEILWETESNLLTPESVLYDPENDVYYVSSYDYLYYTQGHPTGYISRFSADGKMLDHEWIKGLFAPTGMCLFNHRLYVIVRFGVVVFDTKKGKFITQYERKMGQKVQYHLTEEHYTYRDCIREQVRHFARYLKGEEAEYQSMPLR